MLAKRHIAAAVLTALAGLGSGELADANATGTFQVSVTIQATCTIATNALSFGTATAGQAGQVTANTTFSVTCPNALAYTIGLQSLNAGGNVGLGSMKNGGNAIAYNLYQNSTNTTPWGNTAPNLVGGTGTGAAVSSTVYGLIGAGAIAAADPAGSYTDTVTVTVFY